MPRTFLVVGALALLLGACAANARVQASTSESSGSASEDSPPSSFDGTSPASTAKVTTTTAAPAPTASNDAPVAKPRPGCSLHCSVGQKGRIAAADEARLTQGLADVTESLHECFGGRIPSMTLRFDSTGTITGFGVAHETGGMTADSCVDSINHRMPAVSYPGPVALRCSEHCGR